MTNDINGLETKFFSSLGDGVKAGAMLLAMMESVVTSRDTTVLTRAIQRAESVKGDQQAVGVVKLAIREVFPGANTTKDKNGQFTIKIKGVKHCDKGLKRLKDVVKEGWSIRGRNFRDGLATTAKPAPTFDPQKWATNFAKRHEQDIPAAIAALQVVYKEQRDQRALKEKVKKAA